MVSSSFSGAVVRSEEAGLVGTARLGQTGPRGLYHLAGRTVSFHLDSHDRGFNFTENTRDTYLHIVT